MATEDPIIKQKNVRPPTKYRAPAALYVAAALCLVACTATSASGEPGIIYNISKAGVDFIDRHPGIKNSRVGREVRSKLVDMAIGSVLSSGMRSTPIEEFSRVYREPVATMVIDERDMERKAPISYQDFAKRYGKNPYSDIEF